MDIKVNYMHFMYKKKSKDHWVLAKTKFRLNSFQISMAKELGMNPKKFGSLAPIGALSFSVQCPPAKSILK
jgi:uncharacterized protein (DUF1919 family)